MSENNEKLISNLLSLLSFKSSWASRFKLISKKCKSQFQAEINLDIFHHLILLLVISYCAPYLIINCHKGSVCPSIGNDDILTICDDMVC